MAVRTGGGGEPFLGLNRRRRGGVPDSLRVLAVGLTVIALSLEIGLFPCRGTSLPWRAGDPRAAGMGEAYTPLAQGPLAPLWNPAGIITSPGLHGALAASFLPGGEGAFLFGGSVVGEGGPAVAWDVVQGEEGRAILGVLAFLLRPGTSLGGGLTYAFDLEPAGLSANVGFLTSSEAGAFGVSLAGLGGGLFGAGPPLSLLLGASLRALPWVTLCLDLHVSGEGTEISLGGAASVWQVTLRWGTSVGLDGGLKRAGFGCGLSLLGQQVDVALLLSGKDLDLFLALGIETHIPAWW